MVKNLFLLSLISLSVAFSLGFAANENIMVRYCIPDDPKVGEAAAFRLDIPAGLQGVFCIDVINQRDTPVTMRVAAVDGVKTPEGLGTCGLDVEIERFGKYVSGIPNEVQLGPKETRRFQPIIQFPDTLSGEQYGCIAYFDAAQLSGEGISMVYRYAHILRVKLLAPVSRGLYMQAPSELSKTTTSTSPGYIHIAHGSGLVAIEAVNTGTITQRLATKCELTTKGWGTHTYTTVVTGEVAGGEQQIVSCVFPQIPSLVLWAQASVTLAYQSIGIADQPLIKLPAELTMPKSMSIQWSSFFFPQQLLIAVICLAIGVIVLIRILQRKK